MSILQPGTSRQTFAIFNLSILALLGFLIYLYVTGIANIHVLVLSILAAGLLLSVNYVVSVVGLGSKEAEKEAEGKQG